MEYLKLFDTKTNYKAYRNGAVGGGYVKPNVSLTIDTKNVYYNLNNNKHPYVDLDLPSGTLWATCNVGASKPTDYGLYFQWGDTVGYTADQIRNGQKKFAKDWSDCKWYSGSTFTKYENEGVALQLEDDAAHVNMGGDWHMPTPTQFQELIDNTDYGYINWNDVKFTSKKDASKSIIIPAIGIAMQGNVDSGNFGWYNSNMLSTNSTDSVQYIYLDYDQMEEITTAEISSNGNRAIGYPVRGVIG